MNTINEQEILRRRDMRDVLTFTIDPADAKDFDDALSFVVLEDGTYQIGVHIADVTHYVKPNSDIDKDAYQKATSIYLVDRVIPMLPEELCNDLCSLRPNEDKLCMSVVFTIGRDGKVLKYKICRTVICSDYRLTYAEAQSILSGTAGTKYESLISPLKTLNFLAHIFRQKRIADGALEIEQEEIRFRLDDHGFPIDIYFEQPTDANHLIEEWMLLANKTVAAHVGNKPFVYRVHDVPDAEKMRHLNAFKRKMGDRVQSNVIEMLTIRAMAKAVYSTQNIGHYGLQFTHYTHFTSPIRRYPDMMVHRLLEKYVLGGKQESLPKEALEEACDHCSEMEQLAQQAERDSIKEFQAMWMTAHIGEEFDGTIANVTDFGMFVRLNDSHCEGLIHIGQIVKDDYMLYDEKNYRLIAEHSGRTFVLGDSVRVRVIRADIERNQIDFLLADYPVTQNAK